LIARSAIILALLLGLAAPGAIDVAWAAPVGAQLENHVRNPGFDGNEHWIFKGDARVEPGSGRGGGSGARLVSAQLYDSEIVQTVGVRLVPGRRYTVTAWVRAASPDAVAVIGVRWDGGHPRVLRGLDPDEGWSKIEFRFVAPAEEGWRQVVLSGSGALIWDDVALVEAETLEARLAASWEELLAAGSEVYTGLVVNAKGTDLSRGMNPRIVSEDGRLIFAGVNAGEQQMVSEGIVAYATDLESAIRHPRLEVSHLFPLRLPLVVDAQGTTGLPRTAVVIGNADAERILRAVERYDFLGRFAVVFVVEPFAGL